MGFDTYFCIAGKRDISLVKKAIKADPTFDVLEALHYEVEGWRLEFAHHFLRFVVGEVSSEDDFLEKPIEIGSVLAWLMPDDMVEALAAFDDDEIAELVESAVAREFATPEKPLARLIELSKRAEAGQRKLYLVLDAR